MAINRDAFSADYRRRGALDGASRELDNRASLFLARMWAIDSAINAVAAGFQVYSHKKSLEQERDLHEHDCSLATEQRLIALGRAARGSQGPDAAMGAAEQPITT